MNFPWNRSALLLLTLLGSACASRPPTIAEFAKALEVESFDQLAQTYSAYCQRTAHAGQLVTHTRIELAREIRQRGRSGPGTPPESASGVAYEPGDVNDLDPRIRHGEGPIVMVYCQGDSVPPAVWRQLDRHWED